MDVVGGPPWAQYKNGLPLCPVSSGFWKHFLCLELERELASGLGAGCGPRRAAGGQRGGWCLRRSGGLISHLADAGR